MATKKKSDIGHGTGPLRRQSQRKRPRDDKKKRGGGEGRRKKKEKKELRAVRQPRLPRLRRRKRGRAVLVAGVRTPFVRAFGAFLSLDTIDLADAATRALLERTSIPTDAIDAIVWGGVLLPGMSPNVAREIALDLRMPPSVHGVTVTRACASGLEAITSAAAAIERGEVDVVIAGGSDSTSNAEIKLPQKLVHAAAPIAFGKAKGLRDYLGVLAQLTPIGELLPRVPKIAERTTGEVMGEAAERMARRNGIHREAQDEFAARSHARAAAAMASGRFDVEVAPVATADGEVRADDIVRDDTSVAQLARLQPVFAKDGTVTAGNASALTDGAAAVLLMSEEKAKSLGLEPLAALRSWAYVGVDPTDQLLIGPAFAMPRALSSAGMELGDVDLVDMHEAFAAQVLSVVKALESDAFAQERLGRTERVGNIEPDRFNVHGGSIAIGHPFGATGTRMVLTMAHELRLRGLSTALLGICAAGGLGAAAVLERV